MGFFAEFFQFLRERKKLWILPILIVLATFALFLIFASQSAVAPFIYTLF